MMETSIEVPVAINEPVRTYAPGSAERAELQRALSSMAAAPIEVAAYIGGREVTTGERVAMRSPHRHDLVLGHWHAGGASLVDDAIAAAQAAASADSRARSSRLSPRLAARSSSSCRRTSASWDCCHAGSTAGSSGLSGGRTSTSSSRKSATPRPWAAEMG